jgi:hypothetical protein
VATSLFLVYSVTATSVVPYRGISFLGICVFGLPILFKDIYSVMPSTNYLIRYMKRMSRVFPHKCYLWINIAG